VKRVVKGYLKENEKLDAILKNAISKIKSRHFNESDFEDATGPCPANLSTFIDPMLEKVRDAKRKITSGKISFKDILETMNDDQLSFSLPSSNVVRVDTPKTASSKWHT
jgi:hypothetical protein